VAATTATTAKATASAAAAAAATAAATTAAALKDDGNKRFDAKDYAGAIAKYSEAIALDPGASTSVIFYSNRSAAHLSAGDARAALADASKCIELKPSWSKGYSCKGAAHHALRDYKAAYDAYRRGLAVGGPTSDAADAAHFKGMQEAASVMYAHIMTGSNGNHHATPPAKKTKQEKQQQQQKTHKSKKPERRNYIDLTGGEDRADAIDLTS
jgi:tetratricopeptide (TPR) repeat protein